MEFQKLPKVCLETDRFEPHGTRLALGNIGFQKLDKISRMRELENWLDYLNLE